MATTKSHIKFWPFTSTIAHTKSTDRKEETFVTFCKNRKIHLSTFCKYNGQWPSRIANGILKRFKVIINAVYCACQLEKMHLSENVNILIGIHFGREIIKPGEILNTEVIYC
ncbi:MAG: hypothetical protein KAQ79_13175 [Cyclobacteriaceae bacterium]|nr:hypothetical protein [Cyclobacteriaceae bacterium]